MWIARWTERRSLLCLRRGLSVGYVRRNLVFRDDWSVELLTFRRMLLVLPIHNAPSYFSMVHNRC